MKVEGLEIGYQGNKLFTDSAFDLRRGDRCGLVGRNGSGKTTIFRLLTGEETSDAGKIEVQKNYTLGVLSQHIHFTQPTLIEEAALGLREDEKDHLYKVEKILFGLGFKEEDLESPPEKFSGGYQLRLHLAKVLIAEPDCLLLDEPSNYLDIVSIRWFTRFLQQWQGEFILISHDRDFMDSVTTCTMGIHRQKIRKMNGSSVNFYEKIMQEEEIHEKTSVNVNKKRAHLESFIERFGAKASKATQAESRRKMLGRIPILERLKELYQLSFEFREARFPGRKMLDAQELSFAYPSAPEITIVNELSIEIEKGERIAIIGKNGRGKSTILKLLASELAPDSGELKCSDNLSIGYFGQTNIDRLHPLNTIEDEIGASNSTLNKTEIKSICGLMMFSGDQASKKTAMLSGGEKSRVLLGKILATPCNLLLLDEPTHHLDMESIEALIDALETFQGAIILVTHSELILRRLAISKIVVCHQGEQDIFQGSYDDFLEKKGWDEKGEPKKVKASKKAGDPKDQKQKQAALVAARSKALKPIDSKIEELEGEIAKREKELEQLHKKLSDISQKEAGQAVWQLSKDIGTQKTSIDQIYEKLDLLMTQREELTAQFKD
ncbi:MAG: ATP-binding cassette domain-containing protein [Parachlamydiaceae bacterium]|nr:ATP-binding cassette domain-containing protein [Parachlamydiaceae bacterium]